MCFTIPYKIEKIEKDIAIIEGGKRIKLERSFNAKKGEYLQVVGSMAVAKITKNEGLKIRSMIKDIYENKQQK